MKAYADGKDIQFKFKEKYNADTFPWCNSGPNPEFDWQYFDYRTKPEVLKFRIAILMGTHPCAAAVSPKHYSDYENATTFIKWAGEEQEVEVEC